jgi:dTDP-4-amino-4,6-dideoxygalactose transaminase
MLPISRPNIHESDITSCAELIKSGQLVQGEIVSDLERDFSLLHGIEHAIAVANGTAALHLSMLSLGIGKGDEVIVTAYSFVASANAIVLAGATPIFCDTQKLSVNLDTSHIRDLITRKTKAILVVHEFGFPVEMQAVIEISKDFRIPLIEDAACALGSRLGLRRLGTFGVMGCFSFHPRKLITSGEGGMIITSNNEIASYLRSMRNHGLDVSSNNRKYSRAGFNYRMSDISASLLKPQLSRVEKIVSDRNGIADKYLSNIINAKIQFPVRIDNATYNWQTFPILLNNVEEADRFIDFSRVRGFSAIRPAQFIPSEPFFESLGWESARFFNAKEFHARAVALPMFEMMTDREIELVIEACNDF